MSEKTVKIPGPDHPITIEPNATRVVVRAAGKIVADTTEALTLREAKYPPVLYIPRKHIDMGALTRSETQSYCPYKGDASYFALQAADGRSVEAIWTYESPFEAVAAIKGHLAFYPDRVDSIEQIAA